MRKDLTRGPQSNLGIVSAREILSDFIANLDPSKPREESALAAILLEHLLLQGGYKLVSQVSDDAMSIAGGRPGATPVETGAAMWEAVGIGELVRETGYVPA